MYVMPQQENADGSWTYFFEETSLVGRGPRRLQFSELKRRARCRLDHLGIKVRPDSISEEEFCYIPMGGSLPDANQRVVAFGGAAATVTTTTTIACRARRNLGPISSRSRADLAGAPVDRLPAEPHARVLHDRFVRALVGDKLGGFLAG